MCNFTAIKYMHSSGLSFAAPDAGKKQTEHVRVFAEGTSLIAAVELVDTVQCTVWKQLLQEPVRRQGSHSAGNWSENYLFYC